MPEAFVATLIRDYLCTLHSQRVKHQLPKIDIYGEQLFVVAKTAHLEGEKIAYGQTALFVGRQGSAGVHTELRARL